MQANNTNEWDQLYDNYEVACAELEAALLLIQESRRQGCPPNAEQLLAEENARGKLADARRKLSLAHLERAYPIASASRGR